MPTPRTPAAKATTTQSLPKAVMPAAGLKAKAASTPKKQPSQAVKQAIRKQDAAPAADKDVKTRKPKLVRDSFTIPKDEYAAIESLKLRTTKLSLPAKKSELLRAGLKLLTALDDAALLKAMQTVPAIKTGRPKADRK